MVKHAYEKFEHTAAPQGVRLAAVACTEAVHSNLTRISDVPYCFSKWLWP